MRRREGWPASLTGWAPGWAVVMVIEKAESVEEGLGRTAKESVQETK